MANVDGAYGLALHQDISKTELEVCIIPASDSTATFIGDPVKTAGSSTSIGGGPDVKTVAQCAATNPIYGVVMGFLPHWVATGMDLGVRHRKASTAMYCLVKPANHQDIYRIQCDDDGATLAADDIGLNADFIVGSGDATTGMSGVELDTSTKQTTATLSLKILGIVDRPDNALGTAQQDVLVRLNNIELSGSTGTVGL